MSTHINPEYPRAIIHVDGDAFFVGCEIASKPWLRGLPVVVGQDRGIASALSYEAKAIGIHRGMSIKEIRSMYPQVIVLSSDYNTYAIYSKRMFAIVSRYSHHVEHYSIDECFADVTGMDTVLGLSYEEIASQIKSDLSESLGMTFSVGLSVTKVLAKSASSIDKPNACNAVGMSKLDTHLARVPIGKVWGIGKSGASLLAKNSIFTAKDFVERDFVWVRNHLHKSLQEIWMELRAQTVFSINEGERAEQKSVMSTYTFRPFSCVKSVVFSHLSKNIESAISRLHRMRLSSYRLSFFIKTVDFRYISAEIRCVTSVRYAEDILSCVELEFGKIWKQGFSYRTTGVTLYDLRPTSADTSSLFGEGERDMRQRVYTGIDAVRNKFGEHSIFLGSSMVAVKQGMSKKKVLALPSLGMVY